MSCCSSSLTLLVALKWNGNISGTICSGWGWGLIWYLQVEVRKEACLFRQHQIRLTAVPGSQAIFSSSCKYFPCSHYNPLSCSPASFGAMLICCLQAVLFSSSVPYLFDFSNDCVVQVLLSFILSLFLLMFSFMEFLISCLGAVRIKAPDSSELWVFCRQELGLIFLFCPEL